MTTAADILDRLGGVPTVAEHLGRSTSGVRNWISRGIPSDFRVRMDLLAMAEERGVPLTQEELFSLETTRK